MVWTGLAQPSTDDETRSISPVLPRATISDGTGSRSVEAAAAAATTTIAAAATTTTIAAAGVFRSKPLYSGRVSRPVTDRQIRQTRCQRIRTKKRGNNRQLCFRGENAYRSFTRKTRVDTVFSSHRRKMIGSEHPVPYPQEKCVCYRKKLPGH